STSRRAATTTAVTPWAAWAPPATPSSPGRSASPPSSARPSGSDGRRPDMADTHDDRPVTTQGHTPGTVSTERFENPGLPPHVPRRADVDPKAANRASLQVVILFSLSALASIAFVVAY